MREREEKKILNNLAKATFFCEEAKNYSWVNFTNILRAAFTRKDPKSAKKDSQVKQLFLRFWDLHA